MKPAHILAGLSAVLSLSLAAPTFAADNEAGVPLQPGDAAGPWTVESAGKDLCVITLSQGKAGSGGAYALRAPASCGDALPAGLSGWTPTAHGMALVGADGQPAITFGRWSNSLLVSHASSGVDIQLRRGGGGQ